MLGIDRHAARNVWTAALVLLLLALVYAVRTTLFIFVLAVLLAYLLSPLVSLLDRILPTRRSGTRTPALAAAYVIFVGIIVLFGIKVGGQVVEQANALSNSLPALLQRWNAPPVAQLQPHHPGNDEMMEKVRAEITKRSGDLLAALPEAGLKVLAMASDLIYVIIVPILAFFFLKDGHLFREHILALFDDGPRRALLDDVLADVHLLLASYMRALVLLSCSAFAVYSIAFAILHMPYAMLLAATAMLLEFIPMVGPLTASVSILTVAAVANLPLAPVIVFLIAFRMFQDYVLCPYLMGSGVELHPLLVLFGVFAGAEVAGVPGTFLSVPVLALIRVIYIRIRKARSAAKVVTRSTNEVSASPTATP
jgi:predicted PurR-regulated permease PerM